MRLSVKESRMKSTEATVFDRKSGAAEGSAVRPGSHTKVSIPLGLPPESSSRPEGRDLQFHFRAQQMWRGRIASGFRFSFNANCRSLRSGRDDKLGGGGPPWHGWRGIDRVNQPDGQSTRTFFVTSTTTPATWPAAVDVCSSPGKKLNSSSWIAKISLEPVPMRQS
jgi:hypothetical protein